MADFLSDDEFFATPDQEPAPQQAPAQLPDQDFFGREPQKQPELMSDEDFMGPQRNYTGAEAVGAGLAKGAIPGGAGAVAGVYGAGYGAGAGGLVAGPPGALVGGIIGGLGGAFGTSLALNAIQDKVLAAMGWDAPLKEIEAQHPTKFMLAEMAPGLAVARPNLKSLDAANRVIGGAIGGGIEGAQQLYQGEFDATRLGANIAAGAIFSQNNRFGERIQRRGTDAAAEHVRPRVDAEQPGRMDAWDLYQSARKADMPSWKPNNNQPGPDDPAPPHSEMILSEDVVTTSPGIAAENAPAPALPGIGNQIGSPGPYEARGGDLSYVKQPQRASDFEQMGMGDTSDAFVPTGLPRMQEGPAPDTLLAIRGEGSPGVIPDEPFVETGLAGIKPPATDMPVIPGNRNPMHLAEDALLDASRVSRAAPVRSLERAQAQQGAEFGADVPPSPHTDRVPERPAGARPEPARAMSDEEFFAPQENMQPRGGALTQEELYGKPLSAEQQKDYDSFVKYLDERGLGDARARLDQIDDPQERHKAAMKMAPEIERIMKEEAAALEKANKPDNMAQVAETAKGKHWAEREHGKGKGPKSDKFYMSNGAEARSEADYKRKQGDLDKFLDYFEKNGPDSDRGKDLDINDRAAVRDFAKNLHADLVHHFGGVDPLTRGQAYISDKKGHIDTHVIEYLRAAKRLAGKNEKAYLERFLGLHHKGLTAEEGVMTADLRNQDIEQHKRGTLNEVAQEQRLAQVAEPPVERHKFEPFKDPEQMESRVYGEEQNELRSYLNGLTDHEYAILAENAGGSDKLKAVVDGTQDPGRLQVALERELKQTEVRGTRQKVDLPDAITAAVKPKPQEAAPVRGVSDDVRKMYEQQAAAESLTPEQLQAVKDRKAKAAAKPEPEQPKAPADPEDELAALIKSQQADDKAGRSIIDTMLDFGKDESGALRMPKAVTNYLQRKQAARALAALRNNDPYADSINADVGKANRQTQQRLVEVDAYMRATAAAAKDAKLTSYSQRRIYEAIETNDFSKLTPEQKKYYDDWVEPAVHEMDKVYRDIYALNKQYGFFPESRLPDPDIKTISKYIARFGIGEDPSSIHKVFDPYTGRGLSGYSENLMNRDYFALQNSAGDRMVVKMDPNNKSTFEIIRPGQPPQKVKFTQGFTGELGQVIALTQKGKKDVWELDHGRTGEIEKATKRGVRYHQNAPWSIAEALNNNYAALEQMKLMKKLMDDGVIDSVIVHSKKEAEARGYDLVETHLPKNSPLFNKYGNKSIYLPRSIRQELDDYHRYGAFSNSEAMEAFRRVNQEFAKIFNLNAPFVHVLNEANRYLVGRGGKWLNPVGTARHLADMPKAIKDVLDPNGGPWQARMRAAGVEPMWASTFLQHNMEHFKKEFGMELAQNGSKWDPIFRIWGTTAKQFYDQWYRGTSHATWMPVDVLTTMRFMEEVRNGWSDKEAAKRVNQWGADYSIKRTLMGSRVLQQGATDPAFTLFGRWKRSLFESLASSTRNLLKGDPMLRDRAKRENFGEAMQEVKARKEALGQLMTIAVMAYGLGEIGRWGYNSLVGDDDKAKKPWTINRALEAATGRPGIEMRPRGINAPVEKSAGVVTGSKGIGDVLTHVWSPAPHWQVMIDMLRQKDWRGEPLTIKADYTKNPGALRKNVGNLAEYGAQTAFPIYGTLSRGYKKEGKPLQGLEDLAYEQLGINAPSMGAYRYQQKQEAYNNRDMRKWEKKPRGMIPDLLEFPFK